jgi:hypothetical protein
VIIKSITFLHDKVAIQQFTFNTPQSKGFKFQELKFYLLYINPINSTSIINNFYNFKHKSIEVRNLITHTWSWYKASINFLLLNLTGYWYKNEQIQIKLTSFIFSLKSIGALALNFGECVYFY